jgi:autotransporter passenger strand-loop-strand repeat protein
MAWVPNYVLVNGTWVIQGQRSVSSLPYDEGGYVVSIGVISAGESDTGDQIAVAGGITGALIVFGTATDTVVNGLEIVSSGGVDIGGTLSGSGNLQVYAGGSASDPVVESGSFLQVGLTGFGAGGTVSGALISAGGTDAVYSGGLDIGATVSSAGHLQVFAGGNASGTVVESGGFIENGIAGDIAGGTASGAIISAGGIDEVLSGGLDIDAKVGGSLLVGTDGNASGTVVKSGGLIQVGISGYFGGGTESNATVSSGGLEIVGSGGHDVSATLLNGGTMWVLPSGSATGAVIDSGGLAIISGGTLELSAPSSTASGSIEFSGSGGVLKIDGATMPTNVISGFALGDNIDLAGVSFTSAGVQLTSGNLLEVSEGGNTYDLQFNSSQKFSVGTFQVASDNHGGTDIKLALPPAISTYDYLEFSQLAYDLTDGNRTASVSMPSGWSEVPASINPAINPYGLTAVAFDDPTTDEIVISFRGSKSAHDWFVSDLLGIVPGIRSFTPFSSAETFTKEIELLYPGDTYFVTGHSLGGADAEDVAATLVDRI